VKATVPVGVEVPLVAAMVEVKVTDWFTVEGDKDDPRVTVVAPALTD
jgi:hypothetical protein